MQKLPLTNSISAENLYFSLQENALTHRGGSLVIRKNLDAENKQSAHLQIMHRIAGYKTNCQKYGFLFKKSSQNLIIPWKHCIHGHFRQVKIISFTTILLLLSEPWHAKRPRNAKIRIQHPSIGASAPWPYNWIQTGHLPGQRHG